LKARNLSKKFVYKQITQEKALSRPFAYDGTRARMISFDSDCTSGHEIGASL